MLSNTCKFSIVNSFLVGSHENLQKDLIFDKEQAYVWIIPTL